MSKSQSFFIAKEKCCIRIQIARFPTFITIITKTATAKKCAYELTAVNVLVTIGPTKKKKQTKKREKNFFTIIYNFTMAANLQTHFTITIMYYYCSLHQVQIHLHRIPFTTKIIFCTVIFVSPFVYKKNKSFLIVKEGRTKNQN